MADGMTLEEALAAADVSTTPVNDILMVDAEARTIIVPASEMLFGVRQDMDAERKYFKCPQIVGDNVDLSKCHIYISYVPSKQDGTYDINEDVGAYLCEDLDVDGDYVTFSWKLSGNAFVKAGYIAFAVYAKQADADGNLQTKWHTTFAIGKVLDTLPDGEQIAEKYADVIEQLLNRMDEVEALATPEAMQNYVEAYLVEHPVAPTDEQASKGINKWLDEHPEATTTVQDGSLTLKKFKESELPYLTPEMFGAKGDGITDDTQAIQNCLTQAVEGSIISFKNKAKYLITETLYVKKDISLHGNNCTIIMSGNNFNNGYLVFYNTDSNAEAISINTKYTAEIKNFYIESEESFGTHNGIYITQHCDIHHITFSSIDKCICFSGEYIDRGDVHHIYIRGRSSGENYAIYSGSQGDNKYFHDIQMGASSNKRLLNIGSSHIHAMVDRIVAGSILTQSPTLFRNIMLTFDCTITIQGADCILENIYCTKNTYAEGARVIVDSISPSGSGNVIKPAVEINNMRSGFIAREVTIDSPTPSIWLKDVRAYKLTNVLTGVCPSSNHQRYGWAYDSILGSDNVDVSQYNQFPNRLNGVWINNNEIPRFNSFMDVNYQYKISGIAYSTDLPFKGEAGTYYYKFQEVIDSSRLIGWTCGAEKIASDIGSKSPVLLLNSTGINHPVKVRLYRGTQSGVYTHEVELTLANNRMVDNGLTLNGVPWVARDSSLPTLDCTKIPKVVYEQGISDVNVEAYSNLTKTPLTNPSLFSGYVAGDKVIMTVAPYSQFVYDGSSWIQLK